MSQVVLEKLELPEQGRFEFNLQRTVDLKITARQARQLVKRWLFDKVSMLLSPDEPTLVLGERVTWRIPIFFSAPGYGKLGTVGVVDVDVQTGNLLDLIACKTIIEQSADRLAAQLPAFQPFSPAPEFIPSHTPSAARLELPEE